MIYRVVTARIDNAGNVHEGERGRVYSSPAKLKLGGLYFLSPGKLYRVVEILGEEE